METIRFHHATPLLHAKDNIIFLNYCRTSFGDSVNPNTFVNTSTGNRINESGTVGLVGNANLSVAVVDLVLLLVV